MGGKSKKFPNNPSWNSVLSSPNLLFNSQANQNYAKFSEPLSPECSTKPPSRWVHISFNPSEEEIIIFQLKAFLKVQL
jgi:hypothetical protein